jgi:DNA-binding transcriptional regulator YiaG
MEDGSAVYELGFLAEFIDFQRVRAKSTKAARLIDSGEGRNCTLFDSLRTWAYRGIRDYWGPGAWDQAWLAALDEKAEELRLMTPNERGLILPPREAHHVALSVWRGTVRGTKNMRPFTPQNLEALIKRTHTPELQRARRAKLTEKQNVTRAEGLRMIGAGLTNAKVAEALGVTERTVRMWRNGSK